MNEIKFEIIKKIVEINFKYRDIKSISRLDASSPPSVFVGSKLKYPLVNVGIISPLERDENAWLYDDMKYWADNNFGISDVLKLRNSLLNSRFQSRVTDSRTQKKFIQTAQEIAIASKPVDVEIEFKNKLNIDRKKDRIITLCGMKAGLKSAKITGNVKIHNKIDKVINDDVKAVEGIEYLYKSHFNEYVLSKILSVGVLGLKKNRKLVPTRWSITATDDTIGKALLRKIREYKWIENYELFFGDFLGNCYIIMAFPGVWNYELFELYMPESSWNPTQEIKASTDFEGFNGRKDYASATGGGYYASRLPILEYLDKIKRQASVLAVRIETPSYWAGLGVWVCREACRKTLSHRHLKFSSKEEIINVAKIISSKKFHTTIDFVFDKSKLLNNLKQQKRLNEFF